MSLTLDRAQLLVRHTLAAASSRGLSVSVAVVDQGGYLVAAARMDNAPIFTPDVAQGKAVAAAAFRQSSAALGERWAPGTPIPLALSIRTGGRFITQQGALPIRDGEVVVGAIGVSGATSQEDEELAQAALSAEI